MRLYQLCGLILLLVSRLASAQLEADIRISGSNTVGAELAPALVKSWLQHQGFSQIDEKVVASQRIISGVDGEGTRLTVQLEALGSTTGFQALADKKAHLGMSSRPIKPAEISTLGKVNRCEITSCEYVVGLDGIAVIVNPQNPLAKLDKATLRRIFTGEINNWSQLGGKAGAIHLYAPDENSGTYETFKSLVLGKADLPSTTLREAAHEVISRGVSRDPLAIGFVGLPFVHASKALPIADGEARPITPGAFNVATEDYVLARRLFFYMPEASASPMTRDFVQFALSGAGQRVVKKVGFISQEVVAQEVSLDHSAPEEYRKLTADAQRLSLNFRFLPGTTTLDNKAKHDVHRLKQYLVHPDNSNKGLMLFGFADNNESMPIVSLQLSVERADTVADLLMGAGVHPRKVRGYGNAAPVASNETENGRAKNRRVEVWVR